MDLPFTAVQLLEESPSALLQSVSCHAANQRYFEMKNGGEGSGNGPSFGFTASNVNSDYSKQDVEGFAAAGADPSMSMPSVSELFGDSSVKSRSKCTQS